MLEKVSRILHDVKLCDYCIGRQFSLLGTSTTNKKRGYALKLNLTMQAHQERLLGGADPEQATQLLRDLATNGQFPPAWDVLEKLGETISLEPKASGEFECFLCGNIFARLPKLAEEVITRLQDYEFDTFLIGTRLSPVLVDREDEFRQRYELVYGEAMKSHINRELGKRVQKIVDRPVDFANPNVVVLLEIGPQHYTISVNSNPLCVYGIYRKLERGLPQTHWPCNKCRGRGCPACNHTGKEFPTSVEELVSPPFVEQASGTESKFHGAGREDADALCLGTGRPFVVEVKNPKKRRFDLEIIQSEINQQHQGRVEVQELRFCERSLIKKLKERSERSDKTYQATVGVEGEITKEEFEERLVFVKATVIGKEIAQRTPLRVVHRRADKTRSKKIYALDGEWVDKQTLKFQIKSQGGTYIKEFISSDEGRTSPSLAEMFGKPMMCTALDVIEVSRPDLSDETDFL